jgi:NDP-sugar pyrophosphorylase family protein
MQIIIPMSGFGERFRRAGYAVPKPLIEVDGKPIIAHVLDLFPGETDVVFICNREHLSSTSMQAVLHQYCPSGKIVAIDQHKLGPVYAVTKAFAAIDDDEPAIVNYCDFSCYWDYSHFKQWLQVCNPDGCVPAYRGFHPHSLGSTNYAFMRVEQLWMREIQEKQPYTDNKIQEFASSGTYYFAKGQYIKTFFNEAIERGLSVNDEYYCSIAYNLMVEAGLSVSVYELQHFMQWGTPQDLSEYLQWSKAFRTLSTPANRLPAIAGTTLIPMAGRGSRFRDAGYTTPKPLIPISNVPMVVQATSSLPATDNYHFVVLDEHLQSGNLSSILIDTYPGAFITSLPSVSDGQACSCLAALDSIDPDQVLTISACDHGVLFDEKAFAALIKDPDVDIIVWVTMGHPPAVANPNMYGWAITEGKQLKGVSVKKPLEDPATDPIIIGSFTFKRAKMFQEAAQSLIDRDGRVNGELFVDSCIDDAISLGYRCCIFSVDHYLCWGTPNELETFEYWQSCFHKWNSHPYRWKNDRWLPDPSSPIPSHIEFIQSELPG